MTVVTREAISALFMADQTEAGIMEDAVRREDVGHQFLTEAHVESLTIAGEEFLDGQPILDRQRGLAGNGAGTFSISGGLRCGHNGRRQDRRDDRGNYNATTGHDQTSFSVGMRRSGCLPLASPACGAFQLRVDSFADDAYPMYVDATRFVVERNVSTKPDLNW